MTLEAYRITHSLLIEQYQWIEFDLEGLCATLSEEPFHQALQEIERDSIGGVVRDIQRYEKAQDIEVFTSAQYEALDHIRERRNYWCHVCYTEVWDKKAGVPKNAGLLSGDLQEAEEVLQWLREIKYKYMRREREERRSQ